MTCLDEIDILMLENLQKNGRMSNVDLSKIVGISPPPCLRRLRYLEKSGIITGYHAKVALSAVGHGFEAICIVNMRANNQSAISNFVSKVQAMNNVLGCMATMGGKDFILRIISKDYNEFDNILINKISNIKGVSKVKPFIIVRTHKDISEIPLTAFSAK
ncbi:MAG: Lrp/AsnC family transcriptional regulator [Holosporales bacterium]|jgi:DNA-binding Lrp family transcriptional regulator|nr:Lrp/AsnC family transcriptional regulator [Holosporales bacterium]